MTFVEYTSGTCESWIWYFHKDTNMYEMFGDPDHRGTIDKDNNVILYTDDDQYELPTAYYTGSSLDDAAKWAEHELRCRSDKKYGGLRDYGY